MGEDLIIPVGAAIGGLILGGLVAWVYMRRLLLSEKNIHAVNLAVVEGSLETRQRENENLNFRLQELSERLSEVLGIDGHAIAPSVVVEPRS